LRIVNTPLPTTIIVCKTFEVNDGNYNYHETTYSLKGKHVVVVVFYCPYAQSISCSEDINVETDECKHFSVVTIDVETLHNHSAVVIMGVLYKSSEN